MSVLPAGGDSSGKQDDSTDTQGYFHFESVRTGKYILEAGDGKGHAVRVPFTITGESGFLSLPVSQMDTTGSIEGIITYPGGPGGLKIQVSTYGLEHATAATESGRFVLEGLPSGRYDLHVTTFADSFPS
ncbi:MAG: carboxypeptidase-like regulatory domain-containing protein, partial [Fibrobacterota bacterium]|nr:carboxypeptidase-like regulatory domain-containing protein [Fibrobacterota bacterium]